MKVACLVNQYPTPTHSFIRREIAALERSGVMIERIAIRRSETPLVDPADLREANRTRVILEAGFLRILGTAVHCAATRPRRFARALVCALALARHGDRGVLRHLAYLAEACTLRRWCEQSGVDHLHAHFGTNPAAVALLCRHLGGPSYSFTVHGPEEFERASRLGLREKISGASFVVAVSDAGRRQLETWRDGQLPLIHVVRCGIDDAVLQHPVSAVPPAQRLVCVGRLCEQKGHGWLLDAAGRLFAEGRSFELVLVGDGPLRASLTAQAAGSGLSERVTFTGWVGSIAVREQILAARALVLSSVAEGLPVVLMEALALHRPVIATTVGGVEELVDGDCGWLVPPRDGEALANAMRAALDASPQQLNEMARVGATRVRARHDVERSAEELRSLFAALPRR